MRHPCGNARYRGCTQHIQYIGRAGSEFIERSKGAFTYIFRIQHAPNKKNTHTHQPEINPLKHRARDGRYSRDAGNRVAQLFLFI